MLSEKNVGTLLQDDIKNLYNVEKVYNGKKLSVIKIMDLKGKIYKAVFYDEFGRISNMSIYSKKTGKITKNITYKSDGKTISSVRIYNDKTEILEKVAFLKSDGKSISSIIMYNEDGTESQCAMYCDNGEIVKFEV